jgi:hypothetical protein
LRPCPDAWESLGASAPAAASRDDARKPGALNVNDVPELEDLLAVKGWRPGEDFGRHINFDGKRVDFTFKGGLKALTAIGG